MKLSRDKTASVDNDESAQDLIQTLFEGQAPISESEPQPTHEQVTTYQLPIQVGQAGQSLSKGDKPWIVGNFSPGVATDANHPKGHNGLDLKASRGTPIYPIGPGIVKEVGDGDVSGVFVMCLHENGKVQSFYGHMGSSEVQRGQKVSKNTVLGRVGDTGNAKGRGPHLHYEVKVNGVLINPMSISGKLVGSLSSRAELLSEILKLADKFDLFTHSQ